MPDKKILLLLGAGAALYLMKGTGTGTTTPPPKFNPTPDLPAGGYDGSGINPYAGGPATSVGPSVQPSVQPSILPFYGGSQYNMEYGGGQVRSSVLAEVY